MRKDSIEDQVYRANFKAKNGYDPGNYGEFDIFAAVAMLAFFRYLIKSLL